MFKYLFGRSNPTHAWRPRPPQSLTFDLDKCSLNGNALGQPLESLSFLGRDEGRTSLGNDEFCHCYYSLGLCVECLGTELTIASYHIVFRDPEEQKYRPFSGCVIRGKTLIMHVLATKLVTEDTLERRTKSIRRSARHSPRLGDDSMTAA